LSRSSYRIVLFALACVLSAGAVGVYLSQELDREILVTEDAQLFVVNEGDGIIRVLDALEHQGVIRSAQASRLALTLQSQTLIMKPGEYGLRPTETLRELLHRINNNDVVVYGFTIPEGVSFQWVLEKLWQHPQITRTIADAEDLGISELITPFSSPEGLFLPETYLIPRGMTDLDVLKLARDAMERELEAAWNSRAKDLPLNSPYEALILASIIEKETGLASERGEIGGVFTRRLQKGMRLQTDPTVIYGLGIRFDGNLKRRHLRDASNPFNTYRIFGLPPTPIALPGSAALRAATHPKSGDALYFVATGDGSHAFSATLDEHEENVRRYQLNRKKDYRSSPSQ
jgi:UPF0755 protein